MIREDQQPPHVQDLLDCLKDLPEGEATSFGDHAEHYEDELEAIESVLDQMGKGEPFYLKVHEGRWMSFTASESLWYRRAHHPGELDDMERMILEQLKHMQQLLEGVREAKKRLAQERAQVNEIAAIPESRDEG